MSPSESGPRGTLDIVFAACMSGPRSRTLGTLLVVLAATLWGCWSIVFRSAERASSRPLTAATESAVVFFVMLVTMLPLALLRRAREERAGRRASPRDAWAWSLLLALGVTDALNAVCFFGAMQRTSVAVAVLTHYLTPLLVALLAPFVLRERMRRSTLVALALALLGLVLLLRPWNDLGEDDAVGAALGASSAVFYAVNLFLGKRLFERFDAFEVAAWPKLSSLALLVAVAVATGGSVPEPIPLLWLGVGALVCGSLPTLLFYAGLQRIAASQASVLTLMEPFVAVLVGVVVWHETLHPLGLLGGVCVLGGAFLIARSAP